MKKLLFFVFCFLFIFSCGKIEPEPGSTKLAIQNDSGFRLYNVKWSGHEFGDMGPGEKQEREISSSDNGLVSFKFEDGREYRTYAQVPIKKHEINNFPFQDATLVRDASGTQATLSEAANAAN